MRIEHFLCWHCEQPKHCTVLAWHEVKPGQRELVCDPCYAELKSPQEEKEAA